MREKRRVHFVKQGMQFCLRQSDKTASRIDFTTSTQLIIIFCFLRCLFALIARIQRSEITLFLQKPDSFVSHGFTNFALAGGTTKLVQMENTDCPMKIVHRLLSYCGQAVVSLDLILIQLHKAGFHAEFETLLKRI